MRPAAPPFMRGRPPFPGGPPFRRPILLPQHIQAGDPLFPQRHPIHDDWNMRYPNSMPTAPFRFRGSVTNVHNRPPGEISTPPLLRTPFMHNQQPSPQLRHYLPLQEQDMQRAPQLHPAGLVGSLSQIPPTVAPALMPRENDPKQMIPASSEMVGQSPGQNQMEQLFAAISSPEHELQFESYLDQWQQYYMTYQQNCQNSCDPTTFLQYTAQFQSYFTYLNHYRRLLAQRRAARTGVPPSPAEPPPPPPLPPASSAGVKPTSTTFSQNTTFSTKAEAIQGAPTAAAPSFPSNFAPSGSISLANNNPTRSTGSGLGSVVAIEGPRGNLMPPTGGSQQQTSFFSKLVQPRSHTPTQQQNQPPKQFSQVQGVTTVREQEPAYMQKTFTPQSSRPQVNAEIRRPAPAHTLTQASTPRLLRPPGQQKPVGNAQQSQNHVKDSAQQNAVRFPVLSSPQTSRSFGGSQATDFTSQNASIFPVPSQSQLNLQRPQITAATQLNSGSDVFQRPRQPSSQGFGSTQPNGTLVNNNTLASASHQYAVGVQSNGDASFWQGPYNPSSQQRTGTPGHDQSQLLKPPTPQQNGFGLTPPLRPPSVGQNSPKPPRLEAPRASPVNPTFPQAPGSSFAGPATQVYPVRGPQQQPSNRLQNVDAKPRVGDELSLPQQIQFSGLPFPPGNPINANWRTPPTARFQSQGTPTGVQNRFPGETSTPPPVRPLFMQNQQRSPLLRQQIPPQQQNMQQQQRSAVLVDNPSKSLGTTAPPVPPKKEQKPSGNDFASDDFTCNAQNFDTARAGERVEQRSAATVQDEPRFGGGTEDAIAEPMDQSVRNDEFGRPMYDDFTGNWLFERFHERTVEPYIDPEADEKYAKDQEAHLFQELRRIKDFLPEHIRSTTSAADLNKFNPVSSSQEPDKQSGDRDTKADKLKKDSKSSTVSPAAITKERLNRKSQETSKKHSSTKHSDDGSEDRRRSVGRQESHRSRSPHRHHRSRSPGQYRRSRSPDLSRRYSGDRRSLTPDRKRSPSPRRAHGDCRRSPDVRRRSVDMHRGSPESWRMSPGSRHASQEIHEFSPDRPVFIKPSSEPYYERNIPELYTRPPIPAPMYVDRYHQPHLHPMHLQLPSFLEDPQGSKLTPEVAQKVGYARNLMEALSQDRPVTVNELLCIINSVKTEALLHQAREPDPQPSAPAASQSQFPRTPAPKPRENEMKSDKTQKIQSLAKKTPAKPDIASKPAPKISPQASASSFSSGGKSGGSAIKSVVKSASDLPSFKEILQLQAMAVVPQRGSVQPPMASPVARPQRLVSEDTRRRSVETDPPPRVQEMYFDAPHHQQHLQHPQHQHHPPHSQYPQHQQNQQQQQHPLLAPQQRVADTVIDTRIMEQLGMDEMQIIEAVERAKLLFGNLMGVEQSAKLISLLQSTVFGGRIQPPQLNHPILGQLPAAPIYAEPLVVPHPRAQEQLFSPPLAGPPGLPYGEAGVDRMARVETKPKDKPSRVPVSSDGINKSGRSPVEERSGSKRARSVDKTEDRRPRRLSPLRGIPPGKPLSGFFAKALQQRQQEEIVNIPLPQEAIFPQPPIRVNTRGDREGGKSRENLRDKEKGSSSSKHASMKPDPSINSKDRSGRPTRCTMVPLEDILPRAGRVLRKSAIILRGPPGCGKTWVAKELKKMEPEVRILSIDDYFNVEREVREMDAKGRVVMKKVSVYEFDDQRLDRYIRELEKSFKKKVDDPLCTCIVVDACNEKLSHFWEMSMYGSRNGYDVLIGEIPSAKPLELERRSAHKRSVKDITEILRTWDATPTSLGRVDLTKVIQEMPSWVPFGVVEPDGTKPAIPKVSLKLPRPLAKNKWEEEEEKAEKNAEGVEWVEKPKSPQPDRKNKGSSSPKKSADETPSRSPNKNASKDFRRTTPGGEKSYRPRSRSLSPGFKRKK